MCAPLLLRAEHTPSLDARANRGCEDRPLVFLPRRRIEQVDIDRSEKLALVDRQVLKDRRHREEDLRPEAPSEHADVAPSAIHLPQDAQRAAVGSADEDRLLDALAGSAVLDRPAADVVPVALAEELDGLRKRLQERRQLRSVLRAV